MKRKKFLFLSITLCLVLSACIQSPPAQPAEDTLDGSKAPAQSQSIYLTEDDAAAPPEYTVYERILATEGFPGAYVTKDDHTLWYSSFDTGGVYTGDWIKIADFAPTSMCVGQWAALFLDENGVLWSRGNHVPYGQSGRSDDKSFGQVMTNVRQAALGTDFGAAVKTDDTLWVWGRMSGLVKTILPEQVMEDVFCISAVYEELYILKRDGTLWKLDAEANDDETSVSYTPVFLEDGITDLREKTALTADDSTLPEDCAVAVPDIYRTIYIDTGNRLLYQMENGFELLDEGVLYASSSEKQIFYIKEDGTLWTAQTPDTTQFSLAAYETPWMVLDHVMLPA